MNNNNETEPERTEHQLKLEEKFSDFYDDLKTYITENKLGTDEPTKEELQNQLLLLLYKIYTTRSIYALINMLYIEANEQLYEETKKETNESEETKENGKHRTSNGKPIPDNRTSERKQE